MRSSTASRASSTTTPPARSCAPSRPAARTMDAWVTVAAPEGREGSIALGHEHVEIDIGPGHLANLDTIVDPLVVSDLTTVVWAPHGHDEAFDALSHLGQVALVDSVQEASVDEAVDKARRLLRVVLRRRPGLGAHHAVARAGGHDLRPACHAPRAGAHLGRGGCGTTPSSAAAGLLFVGWLASRLGWKPGRLIRRDSSLHARARGARQDVTVDLVPDPELAAIGLAGVTVETASGLALALNRGPGGLREVRRSPQGDVSSLGGAWAPRVARRASSASRSARPSCATGPTAPPSRSRPTCWADDLLSVAVVGRAAAWRRTRREAERWVECGRRPRSRPRSWRRRPWGWRPGGSGGGRP